MDCCATMVDSVASKLVLRKELRPIGAVGGGGGGGGGGFEAFCTYRSVLTALHI